MFLSEVGVLHRSLEISVAYCLLHMHRVFPLGQPRRDTAVAEIMLADSSQLALSLPNASQRLPVIFAALASTGAEVRETKLTEPSLESLFISLTGKELRE